MEQKYPIRVLHRGMSYNQGGIETYLMNYYRHINRNLVQFDFIVPKGMKIAYEDEIKSMGGNVYKEIVSIRENPLKGLMYDRNFFDNHPEISILHVNDCSAANLRLMKTAKKCNVNTRILHSHNNDYLVPLAKRQLLVERYNKKHLLEIATDLFACSKDAGKFMFENLPFQIVKNAVDTKQYIFSQEIRKKMRDKLGVLENQTIIGNVARFDYQKNHKFLLQIFAEYKKYDPSSILVLIGDGPLKKVIENQVEQLELKDSVIFLGVRNDVNKLLNAFDLFVLPSKSEGLGIVLIEAQINGLQCIASNKTPEESNILGKIEYLPLERDAEFWARCIYQIRSMENKNRVVNMKMVQQAGYDIEIESKKLQEFYLSKVKDGE